MRARAAQDLDLFLQTELLALQREQPQGIAARAAALVLDGALEGRESSSRIRASIAMAVASVVDVTIGQSLTGLSGHTGVRRRAALSLRRAC